jgi:dTDP-4-amino-4,6-dideoxygalactose transaminase
MINEPIVLLDLKSQYSSISAEMDKAVAEVIHSGQFIGGDILKRFEERFANFVDCKFGIGVGNATDGLEIALMALNLPIGSEVLVPAFTFIGSSEAISSAGLKVRFVDVDEYMTISIKSLEENYNSNCSAVLVVHLYGQPCDMKKIMKFATEKNLKVVEDCAQAHGGKFDGKNLGSIGHIGVFSFYPGKNLGAYGDAGMITTNDENLAIKCRMIANHGRLSKYDHEFEGRNSRLDTLQAAILNVKLSHLPKWLVKRAEIAELYSKEIQSSPKFQILPRRGSIFHGNHLFVIKTDFRADLITFLLERNIQTGIHYPSALTQLPPYLEAHKSYTTDYYANTCGPRVLSIPMHEMMTKFQIDRVIDAMNSFSYEQTS